MSSTSSSWWMSALPQWAHALGSVTSLVCSPQSPQYQTGIRCPHQSWRLIHHGRMFSIQWKKRRSSRSGMMLVRPSRTAAIAASANGFTLTNHWVEMRGSMSV